MIEHDIQATQELAKKLGLRQQVLTRILVKNFEMLKSLGLKDLSPQQAIASSQREETLITDADRAKQLVLRTQALGILHQPIEQMGDAETNRQNLQEAIQIITEPYYWLFKGKIPEPKNGLFKKDKSTDYSWEEQETTGNMKVNYGYKIGFTPDDRKLTSATVVIASQHDSTVRIAPTLKLSFEDTAIKTIGLYWQQEKPNTALELLEGTTLGKLMNEVYTYKFSNYLRPNSLILKIGETAQIVFLEYCDINWMWSKDKKSLDQYLHSWFEYRDTLNSFTRFFYNQDEYTRHNKPTRETMKPQEFMEVLRNTLGLIPTLDLNSLPKN
jgi:hypothetical protein